MANSEQGYAQIKARLDQIVEAVKDDSLPLDEALSLYEEAIALGSQISSLIEEDILPAQEGVGDADDAAESAEMGDAADEADATGTQMEASAEAREA